jgi:hypothetical protein
VDSLPSKKRPAADVNVFGQEKDSNPSQRLNHSEKGQRFVAWPVQADFSPK